MVNEEWDGENDVTPRGEWIESSSGQDGTIWVSEEGRISLHVSFYHGAADGKPVIQTDGDADFRINVNDAPIWDQAPDEMWIHDVVDLYRKGMVTAGGAMASIARITEEKF